MNSEYGLSLCMLAMPGERSLAERIRAVKDAADEVIVADLGAPEEEVEAGKREGAAVLRVPWENSFGKAKNLCMERAAGRWVLFLHQNEFFEAGDWKELSRLLRNPNAEGYIVFANYRSIASPVQSLRLIRNRAEYRFQYRSFERIPEEVLAGVAESHLTIRNTDASEDTWERRTRSGLLRAEAEESPEDGYLAYMSGIERINDGDIGESVPFFQRSVGALAPESLYAPHLFKCAAWALFASGRVEEAERLADTGVGKYPLYSDLFVLRSELLAEKKNFSAAAKDLEKCLSILEQPSLFVPGPEIGIPDVLETLGELYSETGNEAKALACFRRAYETSGGNPECLKGIAESPYGAEAAETLDDLLREALEAKDSRRTAALADCLVKRGEFARVLARREELKTALGAGADSEKLFLSCAMMLDDLPDACFAAEGECVDRAEFLSMRVRNSLYRGRLEEADHVLTELERLPEIADSVKASYRFVLSLLRGEEHSSGVSADFATLARIHNDFLLLGREKEARLLLSVLSGAVDEDALVSLADGWAKRGRVAELEQIYGRLTDEENKKEFRRRTVLTLISEGHAPAAGKVLRFGNARLCGQLKTVLWAEDFLRRIRGIGGNRRLSDCGAPPCRNPGTDGELLAFYRSLSVEEADAASAGEITDAVLHEAIGDRYVRAGGKIEALAAFLRALMRNPLNPGLQVKVEKLAGENHGLIRKLRKSKWAAEGGLFGCPEDFYRFLFGALLFRRRRYGEALKLFSFEPQGVRCRSLYSAYETGILWLTGKKAPPAMGEESCDFPWMLAAVCSMGALDRLHEYLRAEDPFEYRDLLDRAVKKIEAAFPANV